MAAGKKIIWTDEMLDFIHESFGKLTARQMSSHLNISISAVREKYREFGYSALKMEYWTDEQIIFLKDNYSTIGDVELAEFFESKWPKEKKWTKKHIEKKRNYLKLHRTKEQLKTIHQRNVDQDRFLICNTKRWLATGMAAEGEVRMWRQNNGIPVPMVKVNGRFVLWNRWFWEKTNGPIPDEMFIVFVGDPAILTIENLKMVTKSEFKKEWNHKHQQDLSSNYILGIMTPGNRETREIIRTKFPELIELKKQQLLLNRAIKNETK